MAGTEAATVRRPWDPLKYTLGQLAKHNIPIEQICRALESKHKIPADTVKEYLAGKLPSKGFEIGGSILSIIQDIADAKQIERNQIEGWRPRYIAPYHPGIRGRECVVLNLSRERFLELCRLSQPELVDALGEETAEANDEAGSGEEDETAEFPSESTNATETGRMALQRPLEEVRKAARSFLRLDDENVIDVAMAVYVANKFDADPLWMFFVSPPSTAKTEILMSFDGYPGAKILSTLTPRSLISGKTAPDAKDCSLLPQLNGKLVALKDFTSVLTLRREDRNEIFSQLREIYDGRYAKAFGNEGQFREWAGKIGLMAGVTPAIDKHMIVNQMLGERMLYYRIETRSYEEIALEAINHTTKSNPKRKVFQQVVQAFLSQFDAGVPVLVNEKGEFKERLKNLALVCSHARSVVLRDRKDRSLEAMPEPEGPARLAKQLNLFAMALAVVRGQTRIDNAIYDVVKKTALDGLPHLRKITLEALWSMYVENSSKWFSTKEIAERVGAAVSFPTVKRKLEDLSLLNLVATGRENGGADLWLPSMTMYKWILGSGIFT